MGRKKAVQTDVELEVNEVEPSEALELDADANETPIEIDAIEEGEESAAELSEDSEPEQSPKPRRAPAKRRSRKEPANPLTTMAKSVEVEKPLPKLADSNDLKAEQVEKPQKDRSRAPRKQEADLAKEAKQWSDLEALSERLSSQLVRAEELLRGFPPNNAAAPAPAKPVSEPIKALIQKPSPLTRIAAVASLFAFILSLVSLSLSQNARQAALSAQIASIGLNNEPKPVAPKKLEQKLPSLSMPMEMIKNKAAAVFPFDSKPKHNTPKPEIAMRSESGFKPHAPIVLFRKNLVDRKRLSR